MNLSPRPPLFVEAGLDWRRIEPADERFVVTSWNLTIHKLLVEGNYSRKLKSIEYKPRGAMLFPRFSGLIHGAQMAHNKKLLQAIFDQEAPLLLERYLRPRDFVIVFNAAEPWHILAYGCAVYVYVKPEYRGMGIEQELERAVRDDAPQEASA